MQNQSQPPKEIRTVHFLLPLSIFSFSSLVFILSLSATSRPPSPPPGPDPFLFPRIHSGSESGPPQLPPPPSLAYFISGSSGDSGRIFRLLLAVYHPRNLYLLHLDRFAPFADVDRLASSVRAVPVFKAANNVHIAERSDAVNMEGSSPLSSMLHAASVLVHISSTWDWFINLSPLDYPLVTQDDLLHILSFLPKDMNFINHTSYIDKKESKKLKSISIDPGLYLADKTGLFYVTQKRDLPTAFTLFTGSPSYIVSRRVMEWCILGSENFPRTLLMYLSNTPSSLPNYLPTVLCNTRIFNRTVLNHNLRFSHHSPLNSTHYHAMLRTGMPFASPFLPDDPVLDQIDHHILRRHPGNPVHGGWCLGRPRNRTCTQWGDAQVLRPGPPAQRLGKLLLRLLDKGYYRTIEECSAVSSFCDPWFSMFVISPYTIANRCVVSMDRDG